MASSDNAAAVTVQPTPTPTSTSSAKICCTACGFACLGVSLVCGWIASLIMGIMGAVCWGGIANNSEGIEHWCTGISVYDIERAKVTTLVPLLLIAVLTCIASCTRPLGETRFG